MKYAWPTPASLPSRTRCSTSTNVICCGGRDRQASPRVGCSLFGLDVAAVGLWATHDVMFHRTGHKRLHHPVVGDLDLTYEAFDLPADPGLRMLVYTAEPATPTADALNMLASWAATQDHAEREQAAHAPTKRNQQP
jgi:MmyB-like transcription regulator ligand binding domain